MEILQLIGTCSSVEIGQMTINFKCYEYELAIQQIVFQRLSYMGDKAKFSFNNREFSNNFHR